MRPVPRKQGFVERDHALLRAIDGKVLARIASINFAVVETSMP
jgi:hypothetical protein